MLFPIRIPPTHMAFQHFKIKVGGGGAETFQVIFLIFLLLKVITVSELRKIPQDPFTMLFANSR